MMELMKYYHSLFLILLVSFAYSKPEPERSARKEDEPRDEHYKGAKHNNDYDHKAFLGESQREKFDQLSLEESTERLG